MKIFVTHDQEGNILAVALPGPEDDGDLRVTPEAGEFVSEVEAKVQLSLEDDESLSEQLTDIVQNSRIEFLPQRPKLVRRSK